MNKLKQTIIISAVLTTVLTGEASVLAPRKQEFNRFLPRVTRFANNTRAEETKSNVVQQNKLLAVPRTPKEKKQFEQTVRKEAISLLKQLTVIYPSFSDTANDAIKKLEIRVWNNKKAQKEFVDVDSCNCDGRIGLKVAVGATSKNFELTFMEGETFTGYDLAYLIGFGISFRFSTRNETVSFEDTLIDTNYVDGMFGLAFANRTCGLTSGFEEFRLGKIEGLILFDMYILGEKEFFNAYARNDSDWIRVRIEEKLGMPSLKKFMEERGIGRYDYDLAFDEVMKIAKNAPWKEDMKKTVIRQAKEFHLYDSDGLFGF